jgi:hypothetical protein
MNKKTIFQSIKHRVVDNYRKSFVPQLISVLSFWIWKTRIWRKTRPQNMHIVFRDFKSSFKRNWVLLEYRRITNPETSVIPVNPHYAVRPEIFEMHCNVLAKECTVLSLKDLVALLEKKEEPPDGSVVITINNGHADSFNNGAKILLRHKLPSSWIIPITYIESRALLLEDHVSLILHILQKNQIPFPSLKGLTPAESNLVATKLDGKGYPTSSLISVLFGLLLTRTHEARHALLSEFQECLKAATKTIPAHEDFMKWEEVTALHDAGFEIIPGLYSHTPVIELDEHSIKTEITSARQTFDSLTLAWHNIIGLPLNLYNDASLNLVATHGIKWCLGGDFVLHPALQESETKVLPRVLIHENETFSRDLFLSNIWKVG